MIDRTRAIELYLKYSKQARNTINKIEKWDENIFIDQNAKTLGMSVGQAGNFKVRYKLKGRSYYEIIKPVKDWDRILKLLKLRFKPWQIAKMYKCSRAHINNLMMKKRVKFSDFDNVDSINDLEPPLRAYNLTAKGLMRKS